MRQSASIRWGSTTLWGLSVVLDVLDADAMWRAERIYPGNAMLHLDLGDDGQMVRIIAGRLERERRRAHRRANRLFYGEKLFVWCEARELL